MFQVEAIRLLRGSHKETARTGHGCMMNVVSYLQGDSVITDAPTSVHPFIRAVCVYVNDSMDYAERQRDLTPYVLRVMGTVDLPRNRIINAAMQTFSEMHYEVSLMGGTYEALSRLERLEGPEFVMCVARNWREPIAIRFFMRFLHNVLPRSEPELSSSVYARGEELLSRQCRNKPTDSESYVPNFYQALATSPPVKKASGMKFLQDSMATLPFKIYMPGQYTKSGWVAAKAEDLVI